MLIRLSHDLQGSDIFKQTPNRARMWKSIEFTEEEVEECDILLCLSYPKKDIIVKCAEAWILSQEPPSRIRLWEKDSYKFFDKIFSTWEDTPYRSQPCTHWFPKRTYNELTRLTPPIKTKNLSWITSTNNDLYGHRLRLKLLKYLKSTHLDFDLFGRGFTFVEDKADSLLNYKYSLAIENFSANDYWTEKISDCFLCWTVPFYWGALNIDKYFPKGSFIKIDPNNSNKTFEIIRETINNNYYESHIEDIREARAIVLESYQLFPYTSNLIKKHYTEKPKQKRYIPRNIHPKKEGGKRKLIYKYNFLLSKYFNL